MKKEKIHTIKETGFKVPQDYFKNFEVAKLGKSELNSTSNHKGFKIPDSYFETIEDKIINQVSKKNSPKVISLFNKRNLIYISSMAAAILLFFNLSIFERESKWDTLDVETVENYLMNEDIGSYEIASTLDNIDFSEENFVIQHVNETTIETYLLENMDMEDLLIK